MKLKRECATNSKILKCKKSLQIMSMEGDGDKAELGKIWYISSNFTMTHKDYYVRHGLQQ
jgi:hypothetical protein